MSKEAPLLYVWDGEAFRPASPTWARRADKQFVIGEQYHMEHVEERSSASHRHFFAIIAAAWESLPEKWAAQFRSPEALRKFLLIKAGFCDSQTVPCPSHDSALRLASFVRAGDEFALVAVAGNVVTLYRARSQSRRSMSKEEFQQSKSACLDILADMLEITTDQLKKSDQPTPTALQYMGTG